MARRFLSAIKLLTGSTPPAGTAGDTFFDTDTKTIQVHDGDAWVNSTVRATDGAIGGRVFTGDTAPTAPVAGDLWVDSSGFSAGANILRWRETAAGGETSLSGLDDLGTTLSYTPGYELVHINGVLQVRGQDYVATTGTTITGLTALSANDVVDIIAHQNMVYGDYYTQSQADAKYATQADFPNDAWQVWYPSLGNAWVNGNGTWSAYYKQSGKTVHVQALFTVGSTSIPASGSGMTCSLPVTAKRGQNVGFVVYAERGFVNVLTAAISGTTYFSIWAINVAGTYPSVALPSSSVPFAWASGDKISFGFTYEAA
jgi:hypothetical protein